MPGVTAQIDIALDARLAGIADLGTPSAPIRVSKSVGISPGTDALDKADVLWGDERTLAASATENLDLAGVLVGLLGGKVTAVEVTAIYLEANAANTNDVSFFGAATSAFNGPLSGTTPKLTLGPSDVAFVSNRKGWTVTESTGDTILVANTAGGSAVTYRIVVIGRTVAA